MLKVLHAVGKITPSKGQVMQLEGEIEAAKKLNIPWDTKIFCPEGSNNSGDYIHFSSNVSVSDYKNTFQKILIWNKFRKDFYEWVKMQEEVYDVILLRYNFHDPYQYAYLKGARVPVYLIYHEKNFDFLKSENGLIGLCRAYLDSFFGRQSLKYTFGSIGVTQEITNHEKARSQNLNMQTVTYPNGINIESLPVLLKKETNEVNILFVAGMFAPWHGLDILLKSISKSNKNFKLHLVGRVEEKDMKIIEKDIRVIYHGVLDRNRIPDVARLCDVAIDSLALYRTNMLYSCSLKTRDYLAMGIPVFSGCLDIFPEDFKFYKKREPSIDNILTFSQEMKSFSRVDVREAAKPFIDKKYILKNTYDVIARQVENA